MCLAVFPIFYCEQPNTIRFTDLDLCFFHFSFFAANGNYLTREFMENTLIKSNKNFIPSVVKVFSHPVEQKEWTTLPDTAYRSGDIYYFIQADFGTNKNSILYLYNFHMLVRESRRNQMYFWVSPDGREQRGQLLSQFKNNRVETQIPTIRQIVITLYGCLFQILVTNTPVTRSVIESYKIPSSLFVLAEETSKRSVNYYNLAVLQLVIKMYAVNPSYSDIVYNDNLAITRRFIPQTHRFCGFITTL